MLWPISPTATLSGRHHHHQSSFVPPYGTRLGSGGQCRGRCGTRRQAGPPLSRAAPAGTAAAGADRAEGEAGGTRGGETGLGSTRYAAGGGRTRAGLRAPARGRRESRLGRAELRKAGRGLASGGAGAPGARPGSSPAHGARAHSPRLLRCRPGRPGAAVASSSQPAPRAEFRARSADGSSGTLGVAGLLRGQSPGRRRPGTPRPGQRVPARVPRPAGGPARPAAPRGPEVQSAGAAAAQGGGGGGSRRSSRTRPIRGAGAACAQGQGSRPHAHPRPVHSPAVSGGAPSVRHSSSPGSPLPLWAGPPRGEQPGGPGGKLGALWPFCPRHLGHVLKRRGASVPGPGRGSDRFLTRR